MKEPDVKCKEYEWISHWTVSSVITIEGMGIVLCSARPQVLPVMIWNPQGKSQLRGGGVGAQSFH